MSQSQLQAHPNPFAAPSDSLGPAVIGNPSRPLYESLRIAQIAFTVLAAYVLLTPFRQGSPEFHHVTAGFIIVAGTGYILIRELRSYWSDDATIERSVIRIQSGYSLCATAVSLLVLQSLGTTSTQYPIATLIIAAGWHITAIFRGSMLRQRLQFAIAQSGNPANTSLHLSVVPENAARTTWNSSEESTDFTVKTPQERRMLLLRWIRQTFLTRRAFAIASVTTMLLFVGIWLANCLIPREVDNFSVGCDGDYFVGSLLTQNGKLYVKCRDHQSGKPNVVREICVGDASQALSGKPSISYGLNGLRVKMFYFLDSKVIACYDGETRGFHVHTSQQ